MAKAVKARSKYSFMQRKGPHSLNICASHLGRLTEALIPRMGRTTAILWLVAAGCWLILGGGVKAATVPPGFTETPISGPWSDAVGISFETNGRMWVWERTGKVWFKDPSDSSPSLLLDISEEVGAWEDHGMLGFVVGPELSGEWLHLPVICGGSLLPSEFRAARLRSQRQSIQYGDDRAADTLHLPIFRWVPVGGSGQPGQY